LVPWSSPTVANVVSVSPCTLWATSGMPTTIDEPAPVCRWQFAQWQTAVHSGSASQAYVTCPHKQCPSSFIDGSFASEAQKESASRTSAHLSPRQAYAPAMSADTANRRMKALVCGSRIRIDATAIRERLAALRVDEPITVITERCAGSRARCTLSLFPSSPVHLTTGTDFGSMSSAGHAALPVRELCPPIRDNPASSARAAALSALGHTRSRPGERNNPPARGSVPGPGSSPARGTPSRSARYSHRAGWACARPAAACSCSAWGPESPELRSAPKPPGTARRKRPHRTGPRRCADVLPLTDWPPE
jgi:hypothetical protein